MINFEKIIHEFILQASTDLVNQNYIN